MPIDPNATRQLFAYINNFYTTLNLDQLMEIDVNNLQHTLHRLPSGFQFNGVVVHDIPIITIDYTNDNIRNIIGHNRLDNPQIIQLRHQIISDIIDIQSTRYENEYPNTSEGRYNKKYKLRKNTKKYYKNKPKRKRRTKRRY